MTVLSGFNAVSDSHSIWISLRGADQYRRLALEKRLIPKHMFPFAVEGGGDYFLVDCSSESGEVFYYRHDTAFENNRVRSLGVDLEGFWDKLKEEE